jgi:cytochrome c oxidase assembly protein Cox11
MSKYNLSLAVGVTALVISLSSVQASAEVTPGEAARIRYQVKEHKQLQRMAMADGQITRREQARLAHDAAQVRRLIHRAKNN